MLFLKTNYIDLCFERGFLLVSASPHRGIREQRAMALLGLGCQSAIDLALDEWAAVAEALRYGRPKVTNHLHTFIICDIKVCARNFIFQNLKIENFFRRIFCVASSSLVYLLDVRRQRKHCCWHLHLYHRQRLRGKQKSRNEFQHAAGV